MTKDMEKASELTAFILVFSCKTAFTNARPQRSELANITASPLKKISAKLWQ